MDATAQDIYRGEVERHSSLTAEEEVALASELSILREELWATILHCWLYADRMATVVRDAVRKGNEECKSLSLVYEAAASALRARDIKATRAAFSDATGTLAAELGEVDRDRLLVDRVVEEVRILATGERSEFLDFTPRRSSMPAIRSMARQASALQSRISTVRARFAAANLRLVMGVARRFRPMADYDEKIQEGNLGLLKAIDRFDHRKGFRFSTYAGWWIRHHINRGVTDTSSTIRVPSYLHELNQRVLRSQKQLCVELGRMPTNKELAVHCDSTVSKVEKVMTVFREPLSFSPSDADWSFEHTVPCPRPRADEDIEKQERDLQLSQMMAALSEQQRDVIRKRFGFDGGEALTLREIGEQYSLTKERIRQIQAEAMHKLRRVAGGLE